MVSQRAPDYSWSGRRAISRWSAGSVRRQDQLKPPYLAAQHASLFAASERLCCVFQQLAVQCYLSVVFSLRSVLHVRGV